LVPHSKEDSRVCVISLVLKREGDKGCKRPRGVTVGVLRRVVYVSKNKNKIIQAFMKEKITFWMLPYDLYW
jgi:hypothetical protein